MFTADIKDYPSLVAEASTLGFPPGHWPHSIGLLSEFNEPQLLHRGNGDFDDEGELTGIYYVNGAIKFLVIND